MGDNKNILLVPFGQTIQTPLLSSTWSWTVGISLNWSLRTLMPSSYRWKHPKIILSCAVI